MKNKRKHLATSTVTENKTDSLLVTGGTRKIKGYVLQDECGDITIICDAARRMSLDKFLKIMHGDT